MVKKQTYNRFFVFATWLQISQITKRGINILKKIGIVELNTTNVRMIFADVMDNQSYVCTEKVSDNIKIANDLATDELIKQQSIFTLTNILKNYKSLFVASGIQEIYAIASSEFSIAKNQRSFFEEIYNASGFRFRVLSKDEQLNYLYLAFINTLDAPKGLIVSIEGTKTHLLAYNRRNVVNQTSFSFGSVSLSEKYDAGQLSTEKFMQSVTSEFASKLKKIDWFEGLDSETQIIGTGDAFIGLSRLSQKIKHWTYPKDHAYTLKKEDLDKVYDFVKGLDIDKSKKLKGISNERADIVAINLCLIKAVADASKIENIVVSENGIAEGINISKANPLTLEKPITDVLGYSLDCLNDCFNKANIQNTHNVYELSLILFKQLKVLHKLPRSFVKVLRTASYMHDAGKRIGIIDYERKGFSVVLNSDIYGINHREQILAAFVVASQNLDKFSMTDWVRYKDIFTDADLEGVRKLAIIVKLANALDYFGNGKVKDISCDILGDSVIMKTVVDSPADAEIMEGMKVAGDFAKAFKKHLEIL